MKTIIIFLTIAFASCSTANFIHHTGTYTVRTAKPLRPGVQTITFEGYKGTYALQSDTLKTGDTIRMNVIRKN